MGHWRGRMATGALVVLLLAAPARAQDPIIAKVGDTAIHMSEISAILDRLPDQLRGLPLGELIATALDQLIAGALILEAARADGLSADPMVQARLRELEGHVLRETWLKRRFAGITEARLRERYKEMVTDYQGPIEARVRHILVETEDQAKAVTDSLAKGADFAALARERSIDPTAAAGGDLGFISRGHMIPEFNAAAFALDSGATSPPVKTELGWHVIRLEEKRTQLPDFKVIEERLRHEEERAIFTQAVDELKAKAKIEYFTDTLPATAK